MYVHCRTIHNSKGMESTQIPPMIDWIKKMWYIYTMEYYADIKYDEFVSFIRTWMNLETIILSKLTQEQKTKHRMLSLIGGCWTIKTCGYREGSITHWGLLQGTRRGTAVGMELGRDNMERTARYRWRGWSQQTTLPCMYPCNHAACSTARAVKYKQQQQL